IINGIILNTKKRIKNVQENFLIINDIRFDSFHADKYILFQSLTTIEKDIYITNLNKKNQDKHTIMSKFDLDDWININDGG
ncbi:unnamed protein product, partial [Rotaria sordida]